MVAAPAKSMREPGQFSPCDEAFSHQAVTSRCSWKLPVPAGCASPTGCHHGANAYVPLSTHIGAGLGAASRGADPDPRFFLFTGTWLTALVTVSQKPLTQLISLCQYYIVWHSHRSVPLAPRLLGISCKTKSPRALILQLLDRGTSSSTTPTCPPALFPLTPNAFFCGVPGCPPGPATSITTARSASGRAGRISKV